MVKYKQWLRLSCLSFLLVLGATAPAIAAETTDGAANDLQTVAQSYTVSKALQQGIIVQLDEKDKTSVTTATYKKANKTFGVVVGANTAPVTLSGSDSNQRAYIVTSGLYKVLVSTQNAAIKSGDFVAISAIDGVGMHADTVQSTILGRATTGFDGKKDVISSATLKSSDGKEVKTAIGSVTVDIAVKPNPTKTTGENGVPDFVQNIAKTIVGKPISAVQLYASLAVLITGIGVVASLLYGGIQTGMTAIGRNPLARQSIMRNMIQVIVTGVLIFIGCLVAVYLILKI